MLLKSLELNGFKTFPDKTKLLFEKGITAVVGPNGSGKSNISDAIRWVLGEQSVKILRCSKMEDVIFGGTPTRKSQGFAEVTLNIDNCDRRLNFDDDEIAIKRRYYRSGESEYLINNASVRLKDIHELFMDTGLGRDGYSLVSQGKIDSIVASKSEDRREIFEEAAGISKYRYRKIESERKLKQTEENLVRLNDIIGELQVRLTPLKEQSDKAQKYIEYVGKKRVLEISLWLNMLEKSNKLLKEQEIKITISQNHYNELEDLLSRLKDEIDNVFLKTNSYTAEIDKIRDEIALFEEETINKNANIKILKNDISHNDENIKRLQEALSESVVSFKEMNVKIQDKKLIIESIKNEKEEQEEELAKSLNEFEDLNKKVNKSLKISNELSTELSNLGEHLTNSKIIKAKTKSALEESKNRKETVENSIKICEKEFSKNEEQLKKHKIMKDEIKNDLENLFNALKGYELKFKTKQKKYDLLKQQLEKLHFDIEGKKRRIKFLEDMEKNLEGFNHSVKAVMKAQQNRYIKGIHGTISQLIKVKSKYSVAVETALGAAMQNIVVSTENDAKLAIQMLKNKNAGRATFLPIGTIKAKKIIIDNIKNLLGFVGVAVDLCECKDEYKDILGSLLGRIIVVDNIDNAVKIAKHLSYKFKVVTLDGQVVNAGGSLTGGSLLKNIGILSRKSEIEELKVEEKTLKDTVSGVYSDFEKIKEESSKLQSDILGMNGDISCKKEESIKLESEYKRILLEKDNLNVQFRDLNKEKERLLLKINELEETYLFEEENCIKLDEKIEKVKKDIFSTSGNKEELMQKKEEFALKIQQMRLQILSKEKDLKLVETELKSIEDNKLGQKDKESEINSQINKINEKNNFALIQIDNLKSEIEKINEQSENKKQQIQNITNKRVELEKSSLDLRNQEHEKNAKKELISQEITRLREKKLNIQKEYDEIISKLWDEYELTKKEAEHIGKKLTDVQESKKELSTLKLKIKSLGSVNVAAVDEYKEVLERYKFMKSQIDDVEKSKKEIVRLIEDLTHRMKNMFFKRFNEINKNFSSTFKELFGGGTANLSLTDEKDVLNSGIEIEVNPPGKIVTHLESLSGGEKALVAISLYFAIMKVSPAPFCVLDEIEAALDDVNVDRYAKYLRKMNDNTQFIVVTHRRGTMEEADILYGVTMQDEGVSKLLKLKASEVYSKINKK